MLYSHWPLDFHQIHCARYTHWPHLIHCNYTIPIKQCTTIRFDGLLHDNFGVLCHGNGVSYFRGCFIVSPIKVWGETPKNVWMSSSLKPNLQMPHSLSFFSGEALRKFFCIVDVFASTSVPKGLQGRSISREGSYILYNISVSVRYFAVHVCCSSELPKEH